MKEFRVSNELKSAEDEGKIIEGLAVCFDTPAVIYEADGSSFIEIVEDGALDGAILDDVTLRIEHQTDRIPLARTPSTLQLRVVPGRGLEFVAELPPTAAGDSVYQAVKRGDLRHCSYAFLVDKDSYDPATNTRRIHKIRKIMECSLVCDPAFPQTSVEARNAQKEAKERYQEKQRLLCLANKLSVGL